MKSLKKNNALIIILFAIAIFMSVGFAVLSTTLNINGQAVVKSNTWDIHFENISITDGSVTATKDAVIANEAATLVEYEIELSKPGDYYEFIVDAVNDGTLDSMIEMVTISGIEGHEEYIKYQATYLDGTEIKMGDALNSGTSETYKIRIEYKKDIETLPTEDITLSLVFGVTYSQSKGGEIIANYYTLTGTAYGVDGNILTEGEIEVHSKVITAPINSDGTFIIKDVPVGQHEIYIKDSAGSIINSGTFTLQTGDKTTIDNNVVTAYSNGNVELNIRLLDSDVELASICEYEAGQTWEFAYTGDIQEFIVPCSGTYKLEVWGAQGGFQNQNSGVTSLPGAGGYSSGYITLTKEKVIYIAVGGEGTGGTGAIGGYNGGGTPTQTYAKAGGGGATHMALVNGVLSDIGYSSFVTNKNGLLVAGGGGGANTYAGIKHTGGAGGGLTSGAATGTYGSTTIANQTTGYAFGLGEGNKNISDGGAGGGGLYGGYVGAGAGSGGSGYIGGVTDGETIAGDSEMPTQDGTSTMTGNTGDGYAKITLVSY